MKNLILHLLICLAIISSFDLWGQGPGVFEARVVSVSSFVDSEEGAEGGGPDVTWLLDMAFKGSVNGQLGTIAEINDLWYHKSNGYVAQQEYNPSWPTLTTVPYATIACPPSVFFDFKIIGFEKDFPGFPKNVYDSFDDFYRGSHGRFNIMKWVTEPHIWYPASYIVRSQNGDPLYKFTFEFRYSIDIIKPLAIRAERIGGGSLPNIPLCEGDNYVLRAQTNVGNNASFVWERRLDQTSTWIPYTYGWRKDAITVQASEDGYHYRVRARGVANACLGDTMWQISPPPPTTIPPAPQFYQMEPFTKATCVGQNDGSITVYPYNYTPSGTFDLTLKKNGVVNTNHTGVTFPFIFNGLDSGNYELKVTRTQLSQGQCTGILRNLLVRANLIPTPEIPTVVQHQLCFGANTGQIRVVPQQNPNPYFEFDTLFLTGPENRTGYTYRTPRTFGALPPGDYYLQVSRGGCMTPISGPYTINGVATAITGNTTVTNPLCGGEGGTIQLDNVTGGTPFTGSFDYKVQLSGYPIEEFNIAKLYTRVAPGTYSLSIYDENGCVGTIANIVVDAPPSSPNVTLVGMNATACDPVGSIVATGSGGVGPYEYSLDPNNNGWQPSNTFNDLTPGYYTVFMRDVSHCETSAQQQVQGVNAINLTVQQPTLTCFDSTSAEIQSIQSGGNQSSDYTIELFEAGNPTPIQTVMTPVFVYTFSNLSAGDYIVRVTDADGCEANAPIMVRELPKASIVSVNDPSPACNYNSVPLIEIEIEGRSTNTIPFPARNIEVSINGGPYEPTTMGLNNGVTRFYRFNSDSLTGNFMLRDLFGCPIDSVQTFDRTRPDPVVVQIISVDSASCEGVHDGSITFTVTGAVKPYNAYLIISSGNPGVEATIASTSEDTLTFSNLRSEIAVLGGDGWIGGYVVRVDDNIEDPSKTCIATTPSFPATNLYEPQKLSVTGVSQGPLLDCEGQGGTILATANGGTPPYEYSLDGFTWQSDPLLTGAVDTNYLFARDSRDCQTATDANYNDAIVLIDFAPVPIAINSIVTTQGSVCSPQRDSIILNGIDQGFFVNSVNILWNNCSGGTVPGTSDEANLVNIEAIGSNYLVVTNLIQNFIPAGCTMVQEGIMVFNLTDSNSCVQDVMVPIKIKNRPPTLSIQSTIGVTCAGDTNGSITVRVIDSLFDAGSAASTMLTPPFTVLIDNKNPQITSTPPYEVTIPNLDESVFSVSVIDANGCSSFISDSIGRLSPYDLTIVNVPVVGCGTDSTGGLSVTVNGGSNLPFSWTWYSDANMSFIPYGPTETLNVGETTSLNNLPATTVRAIIQDANTCVDTIDFAILGPNILGLSKVDSSNLICGNANDGIVAVNAVGGTPPILYSINGMPAQVDSVFTGLSPGLHIVQAIDANGCIDSVEFNLTSPPIILIDDITITDATCLAGADGQIQIAASGGAGSLEFALNGGTYQSSGLFTGLGAGDYTISIRDASLCMLDTANIPLNEPARLTSTISIVDSLGCSQNGILVASASGGNGGYQYEWDGGASNTDTLFNAGAGEHVVQITDILGCMSLDTIELFIPNSPVLSLATDTAAACGQANGSFLLTASNGISPYNYTANGQSNMTGYFNSLTVGTYEAIVSDDNGCSDTVQVLIDSVGSPLISQIDTTQTTCAVDDGTISLTVVNGTAPYQYDWSHDVNLNSPNATGLGVGTYSVTVTDQRQCFTVRLINISQTLPPTLSVVQEVSSACGQDNGMAIVSATGGNPLYTFSWSHDNSITGPSASNLPAATYEVIVTDQNGCMDSVDVVITEDGPPTISIVDTVSASCGLSNGFIQLTSTGINAPFIYTWSHNGGILDSMATDLDAGTYQITVTDARNCTDIISVMLTNSTGPTPSVVEFRDNKCITGNGFIRVTSTGGSAPVSYAWSHDVSLTDSIASDLVAGTYLVTVTDQNNCSQSISQSIVDDNLLTVSIANIQLSGCDTASGSVEVMVTGGEPGYTYSWSHNGGLDTNYVDELAAGTYTVTVTDNLACIFILNASVGTAIGPTLSLVSTTNSFCGPDMGQAIVSASGGSTPYTYEWSHDASITDSFATNLPDGGIIVTVRDANNCVDNVSFIIDETPAIVLSLASASDETCEANNGQITAIRSGGTNPVTYTWSHDAGLNSPTAADLSTGTYTVTITDNVGCTDTLMHTIDSIPSPLVQLDNAQNNTCDQSNGSITAVVSSGTPAYIYSWSHNASLNSPMATGLTGSTYTLIVTDGSSCADTLVTTISDETVLNINEVSVTPTSCSVNTGEIIASVEGGLEPYAYSWSHDGTLMDSVAQGLAEGMYTLIVSDAGGCQDTLAFNVMVTASPALALNSTQANDCGQANGQIIVDVAGGSLPYDYSWSHDVNLNDSIANNLLDGLYSVTVADGNGCTDTLSIDLDCETTLTIISVDTIDETCGLMNGSITVHPGLGLPPYSYDWSHVSGLNDSIAIGLVAGTYTVTITDAANSMITYTHTLTNSPAPALSLISFLNNNCSTAANGVVSVGANSGQRPFTFRWSHDAALTDSMANGLAAGTYEIIVVDANACADTLTQTIIDENLLTASFSNVARSRCDMSDGQIVVTPAFGRPPYMYAWSHDVTLFDSIATNLAPGNYSITVSDASACQIVVDTQVVFTESPSLSIVETIHSTCDLLNGSASVTATGGLRPYVYAWSHDGSITDSLVNMLAAGLYSVTVTDNNGCFDVISLVINGNPAVVVSASSVLNETCDLSNGSIALSTSGGTAPFDFTWSHDPALTDSSATGLEAGNYQIIVSDALMCLDTIDIQLTNSPPTTASIVDFNHNACGEANGSITVGVNTGTSPFSYTWSHDPTLTDSIAINLLDGPYIVTVTDALGCIDILTMTLVCETSLTVTSVDTIDETCGLMNGEITVFPGGGAPPYQFAWSHDAALNSSAATNLAAGSYTVTVTDDVNSMVTYTHALKNTPAPELSLVSFLNNNCPTASNGFIAVNAFSGTMPYTYSWSHDALLSDSFALNLAAGTYQVIVSDGIGCADTLLQNIIDEELLSASISSVTPSQCDMASGSIAVTPTLGRPPYAFAWSHDASLMDSIATGLAAGNYFITVSDASGCEVQVDTQVVLTDSPVAILVASNPSTCDLANGSAQVTAAGTRPFSYAWSHDVSVTDSVATSLAAGSYTVTVIDDNGCFDQLNIVVGGSPAVVLSTASVVDESCDLSNGSISLTTTGGTAPLSFAWSHDATLVGPVAIGLAAGAYSAIVTDALMCMDTIIVVLGNTPSVDAQVAAFENNTCAQANGSISIGVNSGSAPFSYSWSHDVNLNDSMATDLLAGNYTIIITDMNGCLDTVNHEVLDGPILAIALTQVDSSDCDPGTGSIEAQVSGGIGNYTYSWSHNAGLNSNIAAGLAAGSYTVSVSDDKGCMVELTTDLYEFTGPSIDDIIIQSTQCGLSTGSIELIPTGGLPPYTFSWIHDANLTGPIATGLASGVYTFEITDARNCSFSDTASVANSTDIEINLVTLNRPSCLMSNGSITISTSGGVNPVSIAWFDANDLSVVIGTDSTIDDLPAGTYVVMVMDGQNCDDTEVFVLQDLDEMDVFLLSYDETCFLNNDGEAHANVVGGGTAPFVYLWDDVNASTSKSLTGLEAGIYRLTVTDFNGCTHMDSVEILQPDEIAIDTAISAPGCGDPASGAIFVEGNGGVGPLLYIWQDGIVGQLRENLTPGIYSLIVRDALNCQVSFDIEVPTVEDITISAGDIEVPSCDGSTGGSVTVEAMGGQTPYLFNWNDPLGQTTQTASNLLPGRYRVTVTDQTGCADTLSMVVPDVLGLILMPQEIIQPACAGDENGEIEIQVAGGSGNYAYLWDDLTFQTTARAVGLGAGQYVVRVTDLNLGCISRDTIVLEDPMPIVIDSFTIIDVSCFGESDGSARVFASGGTGTLTFVWDDDMNQMTDLASGLVQGNYQVTVSDENLCAIIGDVVIDEPEELIISVVDTAGVSCFGLSDGRIKISVTGGADPYTIFWPELNINGDSIINIAGAAYTAQVTDGNGCMTETIISISEPDAISINLINLVNPACAAGQTGQISVNASGGTGVLAYLWNDALMQITPTAFNLETGNYTVVVTDENQCVDSMNYDITGQSELTISLVDEIMPNCFGDENGVLTVSVTGGNDDYIYLWDDPMFQMNPSATNLSSGDYILFVSNADGSCPTYDTISLDQPDILSSTIVDIQEVLCFGESTGAVVWGFSGGTVPYEIDWIGIGNNLGDSLNMLAAGEYKIRVEDNNGCVTFDSVMLDEADELIIGIQANNPICFGDINGDVMAMVNGGVGPFNYVWSSANTDTLSQLNNLPPGIYTVTVTDENGCEEINSANLMYDSDEIDFSIIESILPSCVGADNGLLSIAASGGFGSFSYQWSNGASLALNDMLLPDVYGVTISDALGCAIDTTFDLSQVMDLNVEIGFDDTLVCQNQVVTIGPDEILGGQYSWIGPNGFTSNDRRISVSQPGNYEVSVSASICTATDDVDILNSAGVLQSHFILPTQIVVGDTIVILERSWPTPDELNWIVATDSVLFVSQINDQWIYTFPFAGSFDIGLSAQFGDCNAYIEKTIVVHPDSSTLVVPQSTGDKQILSFNVSPNPSVGFFEVAFEMAQDLPYSLNIYRIDGANVESRQGGGAGVITEDFNLITPANGLYIVSLTSGSESVWKILTIERP